MLVSFHPLLGTHFWCMTLWPMIKDKDICASNSNLFSLTLTKVTPITNPLTSWTHMSLTADHKGILLSSHFPEETEAGQVSNLPEIT